jgi:DUF4097 and DUF4098 domain-containing protein YvlB
MMRIRLATSLSLAALALSAASSNGQGIEQTSDFRWSERIDAGRTVKVSNVNGTVTLRAGSGDRVEVTAVKRWRRGDPTSVKIYAAKENGDVRVCPLFEDQDDCNDHGRRSDTRQRDRTDGRDNDVEIDFTVLVPRGVNVVGATVNGPVSITGATESVDAATVNGDVTVESGRGRLTATTVSGTVHAIVLTRPTDMEFTTVNGNVIAELAANIGVDVEMTTVNGNLRTDYDVVVRNGRWNPFNLAAHIGPAGGPRMKLTTVNGNAELKKR